MVKITFNNSMPLLLFLFLFFFPFEEEKKIRDHNFVIKPIQIISVLNTLQSSIQKTVI